MTHTFQDLGLRDELMQAIQESGYTEPTPIQINAIPPLLAGHDVLGQAQTGTGKTAAFSLPILNNLDLDAPGVQALILAPTRELASQVCNAIYEYGKYRSIRVMPIYGGISYTRQEKRLERSPHIVVGTPGRTIDMMNRRVLDLSTVHYVVLDEADEMLKMGFIDDVETLLNAVPEDRQTAMFSATIPDAVRSLAARYLNNPVQIAIERKQVTVPAIEQRYYMVYDDDKLAALSRILETEDYKSALIFTRTRAGSSELAEQLLERGFTADALHGELNQAAREAVLRRFRNGQLPILVATDVVARGVDIPDVTHVFNFDMPYDPEDYVHRIGRTGRAGRSGMAIMLVTPRERRRLSAVEQFIKRPILKSELPRLEQVRARRDARFATQLDELLSGDGLEQEVAVITQLMDSGYSAEQIAAAAMRMARADEYRRPVEHIKPVRERERTDGPRGDRTRRPAARTNGGEYENGRGSGTSRSSNGHSGGHSERYERAYEGEGAQRRERRDRSAVEEGMVRLSIDVGRNQGIRPGDIVGGIATETGIPGKSIGHIDIRNEETFFDVKEAHVERVLAGMKRGKLRGQAVTLKRLS